jgi:hypothetical protein
MTSFESCEMIFAPVSQGAATSCWLFVQRSWSGGTEVDDMETASLVNTLVPLSLVMSGWLPHIRRCLYLKLAGAESVWRLESTHINVRESAQLLPNIGNRVDGLMRQGRVMFVVLN